MPEEMEVGDWLCLGGMGAYTYGPRSEFNGMASLTRNFKLQSDIEQEII